MSIHGRKTAARAVALTAALLALVATEVTAEDPSFQRDIRPILSDRCFACHGFDGASRQAGLRLDVYEGATAEADSGEVAVVPFQPDESELVRRITSDDPGMRMPPEETGKSLSSMEIEMLRRWIAAGATYSRHWSLEPPATTRPPEVKDRDWPRNWIDRYVLSRLEQAGLEPRPEADPERLLRRLSLDLTGLPPTPAELDRFLALKDRDGDLAYEREVERLLSSPHFGERMALDWLDAARYADTNGYFGDKPRQMWPWRDWVIRAFNENMPFDQFTIEQLAGDLLPNPTREQRIATGFHRNSMANNETGIIDEEYRVEAVADRVETTGTTWLGMTIGCAQCHDHKFDPISQREYYQLFGFFNQSVEAGLVTSDDPPPTLDVPTPEQEAELRRLGEARSRAETEFQARGTTLDADLAAWEAEAPEQLVPLPDDALVWCDLEPASGELEATEDSSPREAGNRVSSGQTSSGSDNVRPAGGSPTMARVVGTYLAHERGIRGEAGKFDATQHLELETDFNADQPWTLSVWFKPSSSLGCIASKIEPTDRRRGMELIWQKGKLQLNLVHRWGADEILVATREAVSSNDWHHVVISYDGTRRVSGLSVIVDGREMSLAVHGNTLSGSIQNDEPLRIGRRDSGLGYYGLLDEFRILARELDPAERAGWSDSERIRGILARPADDRVAEEQKVLRDYYVAHEADAELRQSYHTWQRALAQEKAARQTIPKTLVMQEQAEPRATHLLVRGEYDKPGVEVQPGVPEVFPALPAGAPLNRLGLARWLVSADHPLTARVAVNRLWQGCFGEGLVRTPGDFGAQGEMPTHPDLLDALALQFVDSGWDVKGLMRWIVTSATYRQSSHASEELLRLDPDNRLLARGPRFRLPAELVRDHALAASGLLSAKVGGPSVKPYQPEGLWEEVSYNAEESYVPDEDDGQWRRGLYTYWKRQAPPPALLTFDATTREKCVVSRSRTNTPLQALVLLNDPTYVEAARKLAADALDEPQSGSESRLGESASLPGVVSDGPDKPSRHESISDDERRLRSIFRRVVSRQPEADELQVLLQLLDRRRNSLASLAGRDQHLGAVRPVSNSVPNSRHDPGELAAWTLVAQTILNLDEAITRR